MPEYLNSALILLAIILIAARPKPREKYKAPRSAPPVPCMDEAAFFASFGHPQKPRTDDSTAE